MEEKSIKAISRISAPILNQGDIFGYTDDERQSLRVGMLSKLPNSGNKEFEVLGLGMLPDDKGWTFDGRVRSVDPANILCVITPDIENSHLIVRPKSCIFPKFRHIPAFFASNVWQTVNSFFLGFSKSLKVIFISKN